jgi:hypothetical protein
MKITDAEAQAVLDASYPDETVDCPTCGESGRLVRSDLAQLRADAQALADVRTLDEWKRAGKWRSWTMHDNVTTGAALSSTPSHACWLHDTDARVETDGFATIGQNHGGATEEAARAKAAAWCREQGK